MVTLGCGSANECQREHPMERLLECGPHLQHSNTQTLKHSNTPTPQLFDGTDYSRNRIATPLLCEHAVNEPSSARLRVMWRDVSRRITTATLPGAARRRVARTSRRRCGATTAARAACSSATPARVSGSTSPPMPGSSNRRPCPPWSCNPPTPCPPPRPTPSVGTAEVRIRRPGVRSARATPAPPPRSSQHPQIESSRQQI